MPQLSVTAASGQSAFTRATAAARRSAVYQPSSALLQHEAAQACLVGGPSRRRELVLGEPVALDGAVARPYAAVEAVEDALVRKFDERAKEDFLAVDGFADAARGSSELLGRAPR